MGISWLWTDKHVVNSIRFFIDELGCCQANSMPLRFGDVSEERIKNLGKWMGVNGTV